MDRSRWKVRTRGDVPIEDCAFCPNGHLTAPGRNRRDHYELTPLGTKFRLTCMGAWQGHACGEELVWVEDFGDEIATAWLLGGAAAAYEIIRRVWRFSEPLEQT